MTLDFQRSRINLTNSQSVDQILLAVAYSTTWS